MSEQEFKLVRRQKCPSCLRPYDIGDTEAALRAQIKELREALGFYADKENWDPDYSHKGVMHMSKIMIRDRSMVSSDAECGGKYARPVLQKFPEGEHE